MEWNTDPRNEPPHTQPITPQQRGLEKIQWRTVSSASAAGQLDHHVYSVRSEPNFTLFTKINSKWLKDLRLLQENIGKASSNINHTNVFLGQSPKAIETKVNKWNLIKLRSFRPAKGTINKMRR